MKSAQFGLHAAIEENHWWFLGRRRIMHSLVRCLVPPSKTACVIDVGCGTGGNLQTLVPEYACLGIDPSSEAIQLARRRFPESQFICGAIPDALGEVQHRASLLLLMDVLEHVPDDFWLLSTLLAGMRPGAYLFLTVPADMTLWTAHDVSFGHYRRYDLQRLQRVWSGLPVTVPLVSYYNARLYPIVKAIRAINRLRGRTSGAAGTDFHTPATPLNRLLTDLFASEATALIDRLQGRWTCGFQRGVSLIAIIRREQGALHPRQKPSDLAPDPYLPLAHEEFREQHTELGR